MKNHPIYKVIALAMVLALTTACSKQHTTTTMVDKTSNGSSITVSVQSPQRGSLTLQSSFMGMIQPSEMVSVFAKLPAKVEKIYFQPGQQVKAGDLLFELDSTDLMSSVKTAQAAYRSAAAQVDQMTGSSYKNTLAQLDIAYDTAYNNFKDAEETANKAKKAYTQAQEYFKLTGQLPPGVSSLEVLQQASIQAQAVADQLETVYKNARRSYNIHAEQGYVELNEVAAATLNQAQVGLDVAMSQLENCRVRAPISGVVESVSITEHNMASTASAAFVISNKESLTATFHVSSSTILSMKEGDEITVEQGQDTYQGTITQVGSMANAQTGLFPIKATITTPNTKLFTGMSIKVTAVTNRAENALLIPQNAVYYDNGQPYVYVLQEGLARRTNIMIGAEDGTQLEVTSGLSISDQIIVSWHPNLMDGVQATAVQ